MGELNNEKRKAFSHSYASKMYYVAKPNVASLF